MIEIKVRELIRILSYATGQPFTKKEFPNESEFKRKLSDMQILIMGGEEIKVIDDRVKDEEKSI